METGKTSIINEDFSTRKHQLREDHYIGESLMLLCLLGLPIGLICVIISVLVVWKPFADITDACGSKPGIAAIFAPDITFGNLCISGARAIDLTWNLVVGRGLQASVALISYQKVTGALLRMAETTPIPYDVFVATVFNTNSFVAITAMAGAMRSTRGLRFKANMLFLL